MSAPGIISAILSIGQLADEQDAFLKEELGEGLVPELDTSAPDWERRASTGDADGHAGRDARDRA